MLELLHKLVQNVHSADGPPHQGSKLVAVQTTAFAQPDSARQSVSQVIRASPFT